MAKKSVSSLTEADLKGKRVFVRADFNVPLKDGKITDDTRIRGAIPTIKYLSEKGAKVMLSSHLGRPKGGYEAKFSLAPVTPRLSELLGKNVNLVPDCIGISVQAAVSDMADGDVVLLENSRFYPEEEKNDPAFAAKLAANCDIFVNDAFGTAHRAHGSTEGIAKFCDTAVAGFLLQKELDYLQGAVDEPKRPFAAIVGGSKVSSKISVIEAMLSKVDKLILGGGMVFTFLKANGVKVGNSLVEDDQLELGK
jgi:phosphoglycerate kinase